DVVLLLGVGLEAALGAQGGVVAADADTQLQIIVPAGFRVGVGGQVDVEREFFGEAGAVADVVVEFGAASSAHAATPDAGVSAALMGHVEAALHGRSAVQGAATVQPIGCQGRGHGDIELAYRSFHGFRIGQTAEGC